MFTVLNLVKTLLISAIVSAGFNFYYVSSSFQQSVGIHGSSEIGKIDAFIAAANSMQSQSDFWLYIFEGWLSSFVMIFIGCALLLVAIKLPNKVKNENASGAGTDAA